MPRAQLLPYGKSDQFFTISIRGLDAAEKTFGYTLSEEFRRLIRLATAHFSFLIQLETSASPPAAIGKIRRFHGLAKSLQERFPRRKTTERQARERRSTIISKYEYRWDSIAVSFWLEWFAEVLDETVEITDILLRKVSEQQSKTNKSWLKVGDAWDEWIFILSLVCENAGLPVSVRKDGFHASPFVKVIGEIQKQLPDQIRKLLKKRSDETLAKAISRSFEKYSQFKGLPAELIFNKWSSIADFRVEDGKLWVSANKAEIKHLQERLLKLCSVN